LYSIVSNPAIGGIAFYAVMKLNERVQFNPDFAVETLIKRVFNPLHENGVKSGHCTFSLKA
jgi:hypothetical protein